MHGYYLHYRNINDPDHLPTGIDLKVTDQVDALNKAGCNCEFIFCPQPETVPTMVKSCLPGFPDGIQWPNPHAVANADYLYIRRPRFASKELINFLSQVKRTNPECTILYEVPTYPYDSEMKNPKMALALAKDRKYRRMLPRYVDRIVDLYGNDVVFNIPTLHAFNGINLARVRKRLPSKHDDQVRMVGAAFFCKWHGIDRILEGLHRYYEQGGQRSIKVELAGEGDASPLLRRLVRQYELEDVVTFHGVLDSNELSNLYDTCTLAIASLGMHRIGLETGSTLKTREYLAKGIPFIYAGAIDVFEGSPLVCCLRIPSDESPVDIAALLEGYDALYDSKDELAIIDEMRAYAEQSVSMEAALRSVTEYLKNKSA